MHFYESIASNFDSIVNMYDTNKRIDVIFNELLPLDLNNKELLDAGCGTGWTSLKASERGATVTSMDVGPDLLEQVKKKCKTKCVVGSVLNLPFKDNTFDIVVSTEVIEHVTDPYLAIREMYRVLKPGGVLALTTPNRFWYWSVFLANFLNLRPYQGFENWLSTVHLLAAVRQSGFSIQKIRGIHSFPFHFSFLHGLLDFMDKYHRFFDRNMINQSVLAKK